MPRFPHHLTSLSVRSRSPTAMEMQILPAVLSRGQHRPNTKQCHHHTQYQCHNSDTVTCSATATDSQSVLWSMLGRSQGPAWAVEPHWTYLRQRFIPTDTAECTASVTDSDGGSATDSATITVDNRASSSPTVISQPQPKDRTTLYVQAVVQQMLMGTVTYTYS